MNLKHTTVECVKIPSTHCNKVGWVENYQKHICLTMQMQPATLLIGDSIVAGLIIIINKYFYRIIPQS